MGMFGDLSPSELISLQELQSHVHPDHSQFTQPPSLPKVCTFYLCS